MFKKLKKILATLTTIFLLQFYVNAQKFSLVTELSHDETEHTNWWINFLGLEWWKFRKNYLLAAKDLSFFERLASWILTRDDIPNFLVLVVQFLSQLGLVVWVIFIMYAWYKYILSVFNWWQTPNSTIKNAIIWVIIIIFSYAIMRILTSFIWLT